MAKNTKTRWGTLTIFNGPTDPEHYETEEETKHRLRSMIRVLTITFVALGSGTYKLCAATTKLMWKIGRQIITSKRRLKELDED